MSANAWYPRYIGDYSRKTAHLTLAEHGAYAVLLDWYYSNARPLPAELMQLHRICRAFAADEQAAVQSVVAQFFELREDGWHNERADQEVEKRRSISGIRQNAAEARWCKGKSKRNAIASANGDARAHTITTTVRREGKPSLPPKPPLPDWVPVEAWQAFTEMRKTIKKPMTPKAEVLMLNRLDKMRQQGHDPTTVLDQSTRNNWQDIYEPKGDNHANAQRNSAAGNQQATGGKSKFQLAFEATERARAARESRDAGPA